MAIDFRVFDAASFDPNITENQILRKSSVLSVLLHVVCEDNWLYLELKDKKKAMPITT